MGRAARPPRRQGEAAPRSIPERLLARLWEKRAARREWLYTSKGRRIRVIYPGRSSSDAGPDFRDALLQVEGMGLVRGDVELHRRQQDWQGHGHGDDPRYNGVVLHAALDLQRADSRATGGHAVPTLSLAPLVDEAESSENPPDAPLWDVLERQGFPRPTNPEALAALLDRAGDVRFFQKSARFHRFLAEQPPDQALYEGIMEALGYRHNQQPFRELAARAPYQALCRASADLPDTDRAGAVAGWLKHLSGLSPEGTAPEARHPRGLGSPLAGGQWRCFRVRPANHPLRRMDGAARLLVRFLETGLVSGLRPPALQGSPTTLTDALMVGPGPGGKEACIGAGRARDLAVNAALPFFHALESGRGDWAGGQPCLDLYRRVGKLQDSGPTREMRSQLLPPEWTGLVTTARRQQGLLHLHHLARGAG